MTTKTGQRRQKSWRQECGGMTAGTGKLGLDSLDRTAKEDSQESMGRTRKRGQNGQKMVERQGSWHRTTEMGHLWQDHHDNKVGT
jgi:hypothetical protein